MIYNIFKIKLIRYYEKFIQVNIFLEEALKIFFEVKVN